MKRWAKFTAQVVLAGAFGIFTVLALMIYSPYPRRPPAGATAGKVVHGWLVTYANDNDGRLPARLEELKTIDTGVPEDYDFSFITEYRGAGKNVRDLPSGYLLMRCRAGRHDDREARVSAAGSVITKKPEAWANAEATQ